MVRGGEQILVENTDLVVGDVVILDTGDKVVADALVIDSQSLTMDEASLTGESDPMKKNLNEDPWVMSGTQVGWIGSGMRGRGSGGGCSGVRGRVGTIHGCIGTRLRSGAAWWGQRRSGTMTAFPYSVVRCFGLVRACSNPVAWVYAMGSGQLRLFGQERRSKSRCWRRQCLCLSVCLSVQECAPWFVCANAPALCRHCGSCARAGH